MIPALALLTLGALIVRALEVAGTRPPRVPYSSSLQHRPQGRQDGM